MTRARSFVASAAAVTMTAAGLSLATPASPAFASASFVLSPNAPIKGESFAATGRVSTAFQRPVVLRVWRGGAWRTAQRRYTTRTGTYRFAGMRTAVPVRYSVVARAFRHNGRTYAQAVTATRTARPVGQTASLSLLPPVAQRGTVPARAAAATNSVVARFRPARPRRSVTFQRLVNGSWVSSRATSQRSDGTAIYRGILNGATVRAVAAARYGAPAVATSPAVDDWRKVFDDEFSGSSLNGANWSYRNSGQYLPSRTKSSPDQRAVSVGGGTLALRVKVDPASRYRLLNGQISTQDSFRFKYGVAAARIKFPVNRGQHGSFWLQSPSYGAVPGSAFRSGAEIDAVEFFGKGYPRGGLANFLYYRNSARRDVQGGGVWSAASRLIPSSDTWWNSYHVFSVKWTPQSYTFYVDGQQLYYSTRALSGVDEYLILSLLSSDWELKYLDRRTVPTMRVDWARVWQH